MGDLTREAVKEAQALGLTVVVWTANNPADMRRVIEWGVDGVISDRPDLLRQAAGGAVWSPYSGETTREQVREAQALGLKVVVWTVNEPADMRRMIEWGVDGLISDYPDILRKTAGEMGVALPPATPVAP